MLALLVALAIVGLPAVALRAACAGKSCVGQAVPPARVPFCPLPSALKEDIAAGFREGRSPDVLGVAMAANVSGGTALGGAQPAVAWPAVRGGPNTSVPIAFSGPGVSAASSVPPGTQLDAIAPTLADILGFHRPHPDVRAGQPVAGVDDGVRPSLILEIAWKGIGAADLQADPKAWPFLRSLVARGAGTLQGDTGSVPLDPTATLTTIGTGGLPSQHGMTGTLVRTDEGETVRAWGPGSPLSVISTLPDDLDQAFDQRPKIGLVATDVSDRGLIGGTWYIGHDRDDVVIAPGDPAAAVARLLRRGYGADAVPDVLGVVLQGPVDQLDALTRRIVEEARRATGGSTLTVVAGTGSAQPTPASLTGSTLASDVDRAVGGTRSVVEAAVAGGLFLDQRVLAAEGISGQTAVDALFGVSGPNGEHVMDDAFQGFAVSFARYC